MAEKDFETGLEIAVIGMAGRFPGARDIDEFWNNLKNGCESISFFSEEEMKDAGGVPEQFENPSYVKAKSILEDIEYFDSSFFSYTPNEGEIMDPQVRIFHECAWEALEDSGYDSESYDGLIGLFAGASSNFYWEVLAMFSARMRDVGRWAGVQLKDKDFLSLRVAYKLGLKGPAIELKTACSTSLVAIHVASQAILNGECDIALAGGITVTIPHLDGYLYREGMVMSPDGHCRAFDSRAAGTVAGEGAGIVVLKRLEDAVADRDYIHAVIKGSAVNNDGIRRVGFSAPSIEGQAEAVRIALQVSRVEPESIGYIESHGTGTELGDPVEMEALKLAFNTDKKGFCAIGSVKSNVGHLDSAAGVAGFIKAVLALKYKQIPPSLHFEKINPRIDFENSPFYVNERLREWKRNGSPLRLGVSSFGIGGTNAHVVLEEWPVEYGTKPMGEHPGSPAEGREYRLLLLSAKSESALEKMTENLLGRLKNDPGAELADIAYTLQVGRKAFPYRRKLVCSDISEAVDRLTSSDSRKMQTYHLKDEKKSVIFMFSGLGSQYVNMGLGLYRAESVFRKEMDRCFEILQRLSGEDIKEILYPARRDSLGTGDINRVEISQLVVFVFEYSLARLLMTWGIHPRAMIGYSFGEYVAACLSGVFSLENALKLLVIRGRLIRELPRGMMLSVPLSKKELEPLLTGQLSIGIDNGSSCVVSGSEEAVKSFEKRMKEKKLLCMPLDASHAIHSIMMDPVLELFEKEIASVPLNSPQIPYISCVTGHWIAVEEATSHRYWAKQLRETVHFARGIKSLIQEPGSVFLEVGAGRDISALVKREMQIDNNSDGAVVNLVKHRSTNIKNDIPDDCYFLDKIGLLWFYGIYINWEEYYSGEKRYRVSLPTYPFERHRQWKLVEESAVGGYSIPVGGKASGKSRDLSDWFYIPSWKRQDIIKAANSRQSDADTVDIESCWLVFMDSLDLGDRITEQLKKGNGGGQDGAVQYRANPLITVKPGLEYKQHHSFEFEIDPKQYDDYEALVKQLDSMGVIPSRIVHLWGITGDAGESADPEVIMGAQDFGFYSLLNLAKALGSYGKFTGKIEINVVTDNMQEVTGDETLHPGKASVLGPCRVIPQEYPGITCKSIDISEWQNRDVIDEILAEMTHGALTVSTGEPVVAFRGHRRWVQVYEPVRLEASEALPFLRQGGVYLIIGGLGDIGFTLAEFLIKRLGAKVILTGRSQLPLQEMWAQYLIVGDKEDKTYRNIRKLQQLKEAGGEVLYFSADISDAFAMQQVITRGEARFGPINGVIHSAGIISGESFNTIANITPSQCRLQFQAKLNGLVVLEDLLKDKTLDFCLMISSIAAVLGGLGFVAYSAVNHFMDTFSLRHNQKRQTPWIIVDWDGTTKEDTAKAFHRIFSTDGIQQVVFSVGGDLEGRISRWVKLEGIGEKDGGKTEDSGSLYSRPELSNPYVAPRNAAEKKLADIWQRFFGIEKIGVIDDLFDLGGDSLKAMNIIALIQKELNVTIPIKEFLEHSTIEGAAKYITGAEKEEYLAVSAVEEKEYYRLTPAQKRLYILQQMDKKSIAYNSPMVVRMDGGLDRQRLESAIRQLIERHESFRTSILMIEQEPMQVIHDTVDFKIECFEVGEEGETQRKNEEEIIRDFVRPFDLSCAPFLRIGLIEILKHRHLLIIDIHHIVTDGVSHEVFVKEFRSLYDGEELPRLPLQYKDYAGWLNSPRQQKVLERQKAFWLQQFEGEIPVLALPTDYARPTVHSFEGRNMGFGIGKEETQRLKELATAEEVTLYMVLLAIYDVFLAKITGQDDVVVGTGVVGRRHADLRDIIGIFINTLALRNYPNSEKTFTAFLKEIKDITLAAFENQEYPFEDLVERVALERDTSRNPLFDAMLVLQNVDMQSNESLGAAAFSRTPTTPAPTADLNIKPHSYQSKISKFDITLFVEEVNNELHCYFEYCTKLFKTETMREFVSCFKEIACSCGVNPNQTISEMMKISAARRDEIIRQLNRELKAETFAGASLAVTLQQTLNRRFKKDDHRTAVEYGEKHFSYRELDRRSNRVAHRIINRRIPQETLIGILLDDRMDFITVMIGILKARCIFVPLDSAYPQSRLESMIGTTGMELVVTDSKNSLRWQEQGVEIILMDRLVSFSGDNEFEEKVELPYNPEDSVYIYFTSGTTGTPRGMKGINKSLLHFIQWEIETFGVDEAFRFSQLTTPVFDAFLRDILVPLCTGGMICIPRSKEILLDSLQFIDWVERSRICLMHCVPGLFRLLASPEYISESRFKGLKYILLSGERINPSDLKSWYAAFGSRIQLVNLWGTSETTLAKTFYFVEPSDIYRERIPVGVPLPGARVVVLDENMDVCDRLVTGELYIKTPFRTSGYVNDPALNNQRFVPDPFTHDTGILLHKTGDLGRILADGTIDVIGRNDRQVKIRGIRVELEEIESVFMKHPLVSEAAVLKKENELLCAYITLTSQAKAEEDNRELLSIIKAYISERLPDYSVPARIQKLETMPRKPSGKINYDALPDPLEEAIEDFQLPRDRVEAKIMELWIDLLGVDNISVTQSFFELGGNSLNIMILASRIHREFDVRIPLVEIFNQPTIRQQARIIQSSAREKYASIEPVEEREYYPQSSAQKRLFFLDKFDEVTTSYNMSGFFGIGGKLDKKRYERMFRELVAHHETLRTSFEIINDEPVQRVHKVEDLEFPIEYFDAAPGEEIESVIKNFVRPFDLSMAPLVRVGLVKMTGEEYLLLFDLHHIVSDGTSMRILPTDFMKLGAGEELPLLRVQYKDFSLWQNQLFDSGGIKGQEEYWLNLYRGEIPRLNMPIDFHPPEVFTFEGDRYRVILEEEELVRLREMCIRHHVTIFMNLLAAFNVLLFKHSGQEDIIVGCDIVGRPHADLQDIIGMFVNMLPMRNYPRGTTTYLEFLEKVKDCSLNAFENQDVQFENLVDQLNLERDPAKNPLFDVEFQFRDIDRTRPGNERNQANIPQSSTLSTHTSNDFDNNTSRFDMALEVYENIDMLILRVEYYTKIFKRETIELLMKHYLTILRTLMKHPEVQLSQLDIMSKEERQQVLFDFNQTRKDFPKSTCYPRLFREQAADTPDGTAAVHRDEYVSYAHLDEESDQLANYLCHGRNIRPGDRVGVLMDRSLGFLTAFIGILKADGVYVPLVPSLPEERIKKMIDDARIDVVISQEKYLRTLDRLQWECDSFSAYICMDTRDIYGETDERNAEWLNQEKLWEYIGETAVDDITGGGWLTSYTGKPFSEEEMNEYGDNALKKLIPLLNPHMRVLEIGCASGITMFRVAPRVGFYYGTDFSRAIIQKNREKVDADGHQNIALECLAGHEIDKIKEKDFDLIILNSVIQSFHGHNYLIRVLRKAVRLLKDKGFIYAGDIMDLDLKEALIAEMTAFKKANKDNKEYTTKTDFSEELFLSRRFFKSLAKEIPAVRDVEFSDKIHTIENELTKFRYDALIRIDKKAKPVGKGKRKEREKYKYQHDLRALNRFGKEGTLPEAAPENLAYMIYTSGTTGQPKGVMIHHLGMINHLYAKIYDLSVTAVDIVAQTASAGFDISVWQFLIGLMKGGRTVIVDKDVVLDPAVFLQVLQKQRVTILESVPSLMMAFVEMLDYEGHRDKGLKHLRWMIPTGEALPVKLVREWYKHYPGIKLVNAYGPTEASDDVTHYVVEEMPPGNQKSIPIGKPLQNLHIYILDYNLSLCPVRVRGEICVAGIGVGKGYWEDSQKTAQAFIPNPYMEEVGDSDYARLYRTGDIGYWREDGNIECLGRVDHQVKIRGNRIELGEIENRLLSHDHIKEAVVMAIDAVESEDKYLCAYIVTEKKTEPEELRDYLSSSLPDYMIPSYIVPMERMPLTPNGKIDRKALPAPEVKETGSDYTAPRNKIETKLAEIWAGILGIEKDIIGIDVNFFDLGGHSLRATLMNTRIHKELNVKVPLAEIFKTPTIRALSQYIAQAVKNIYEDIRPVEKREYHPQSSAQKRLFFLDQFEDIGTSYNMPYIFKVWGEVEREQYEKPLRTLIARHEALKTSFGIIHNEPVQRIHEHVDFEIEEIPTPIDGENVQTVVNAFVRPFDLSKAPLMRAGVAKLAQNEYLLLFDMHHIIGDGTSLLIFSGEFSRLFSGKDLPSLKLQYKDFALWQNNLFKSGEIKKQEEYWLNLYSDIDNIPVLNLPTDYPRQDLFTFEGASYNFKLDAEDTFAFRELAKENSATLYMNLLAVFNVLLYKYTGQSDIIVGSGIAGRPHSDLQDILGMFVNTLAIRNYPEGSNTYLEFLNEVKENCVKAFENQDMQFEELVDRIRPGRAEAKNPLFSVELNVQNYEAQRPAVMENEPPRAVERNKGKKESEGSEISEYAFERTTSKFDMILFATEVGDEIYFKIEFSTALFKLSTIEKMAQRYIRLIKKVVEDSTVKIKEIKISHEFLTARPTEIQAELEL